MNCLAKLHYVRNQRKICAKYTAVFDVRRLRGCVQRDKPAGCLSVRVVVLAASLRCDHLTRRCPVFREESADVARK